ncbi:hypothetical protein BCR43DRAFT_515678 [Syncephalastrum racemosum]|uniref:Uncharacterized protein n=1 Tax=Syncephalastrum racemosum TaxID=13706 RepID=A0A1X2HA56_SYNRA|nr:hypothetical protein BCR43DRAFT_515678 [Syncephalastrum racemosum]
MVFAWREDHLSAQQQSQRIPGIWTNETPILYAARLGHANGKDLVYMESSSGYSSEDYQHSTDCTEELIATYGVQCARSWVTLMKTNLSPGHKYPGGEQALGHNTNQPGAEA